MPILILFLAMLAPVLISMGIVWAINRQHLRFINPLTKSLRRPPGAQLGRELGQEQLELGFGLIEMLLPGFILVMAYLQFLNSPDRLIWKGYFISVVIGWLAWEIYAGYKLIRRLKRIKTLRLAYECELAVGQELDLLMLHGFRVFHDIPADKFNIDHVVIGPPGVFAVETKGRSKVLSDDGEAKKQFRVSYQKGVLQFPNGIDKETVPQAERQAKWVHQWLSESTGQAVPVRPLIVLPGWYIDIKDSPTVPVIASGYIQRYFLGQKLSVNDQKQIKQICYQIDQRVRDLPPGEVVRPLAIQ